MTRLLVDPTVERGWRLLVILKVENTGMAARANIFLLLWQQRRSMRRSERTMWLLVGLFPLIFLGWGFTVVEGAQVGSKHETRTCEVTSVSWAQWDLDGMPSWRVHTSCGGALYINPDDTHQTAEQATDLFEELVPGQCYALNVKGELNNWFDISAGLISAERTTCR